MSQTSPTLEPTSWTPAPWRQWGAQGTARWTSCTYIFMTAVSLYECHKLRRLRAASLYIGQVTLLSLATRYHQKNFENQISIWCSETKVNIERASAIVSRESDAELTLPKDEELPRLAETLWRVGARRRLHEINSVATAAYRQPPLPEPSSRFRPGALALMDRALREGNKERMHALIVKDLIDWRETLREHAVLFQHPPSMKLDLFALSSHGAALTITTLIALAWLIRHGHLRPIDTYAIYTLSRLRLLPRRFLPKAPLPIPIRVH